MKDSLTALQPETQEGKTGISQETAGAQVDSQQLSTSSKSLPSAAFSDEAQSPAADGLNKEVQVSSNNGVAQLGKHVSVASSPVLKVATGVNRENSPKHEVSRQAEHDEVSTVPSQPASAKAPAVEPAPVVTQTAASALTGITTSLTSDPLPQTHIVSDVHSLIQDKAHITATETGKSTQSSPAATSKKHPKVNTSRTVDVQSPAAPIAVQSIVPQQVASNVPVSHGVVAPRVIADQVTAVGARSASPTALSSTPSLPDRDVHTADQSKDATSPSGDTVAPASTSIAVPVVSSSIAAISSAPITHTAAEPVSVIPHVPEGSFEQVASRVTNLPVTQASAHDVASPLSYQPGAPPAHETLAATPNVLEVGVASGTHGWVRVRAELQPASGEVTASVVANSAASAESLHRQLPALTAYLASERLDVSSVVINRSHSSQSTFDTNSSSSGSASQQGAADGQPRSNSDTDSLSSFWSNSQGDQEGSNAGVTHDTLSAEINISAGSWLSVRA
jgi:hypothetical protein